MIVDKNKNPQEDQTPAAGKYLLMQTHIPPTLNDNVSSTPAFEIITDFDHSTYRMAWQNIELPSALLKAERWQALSTTPDNQTYYESREVFGGAAAYLIKWFISKGLMESFDAATAALKATAEEKAGTSSTA